MLSLSLRTNYPHRDIKVRIGPGGFQHILQQQEPQLDDSAGEVLEKGAITLPRPAQQQAWPDICL